MTKRKTGTDTDLGEKDEVLLHGKCPEENVVLRAQPQAFPNAVNVGADVLAVDVGCS